jgi:hypothetical protein
MKNMNDEQVRRPDELNAFEYLYEHLKEKVLKGGYRKEFLIVKENILAYAKASAGRPEFAQFKSFRHLLETTKKESLRNIKEMAVREVVELYQRKEDLRPASGVVLVMLLWGRLVKIAPGDWFDNAVYWLLEEAQCINPDNPGIVDDLIAVVKKKMHGKRFYSNRPDEKKYFKNWLERLEDDEEEATDYTDYIEEE